ncbi:alkene reductase [Pseudalkalibacillus sp. Hm43]|uniref:oxidoreductase n=1 Tax=Pseudalkalibacillus sp. Hm43 TaxID=3450742 RepID=UPI003F432D9A
MEDIYPNLLSPFRIGNWKLKNKITMAPMTRGFADDKTGVVGDDVVEYYRKRAADGVGLIITEGIIISPRAKGTFNLSGLYTNEQVKGWRKVTDAVHEEYGTIIAQLWHVGRLTHHEVAAGLPPQAPSAIRAIGHVHRYGKPFDRPEEMTEEDIKETIKQYATAAHNAMQAGFDGVEVHGAHGYLIDQFNSEVSNHRTDEYGGHLAKRITFMKEVLQAVMSEAGDNNTIIRFSELKDDAPQYKWRDPETTIQTFTEAFKEVGIKIIHPSVHQFDKVLLRGQTFHEVVRKHWDSNIIGVGNLNPEMAETAIQNNVINLAAFGRPLLANPDFVTKLERGKPLEIYDSQKHLIKLT